LNRHRIKQLKKIVKVITKLKVSVETTNSNWTSFFDRCKAFIEN